MDGYLGNDNWGDCFVTSKQRMKITINIKGWRRLRKGTKLRKGDCWLDSTDYGFYLILTKLVGELSDGQNYYRKLSAQKAKQSDSLS